MAHDVSESDWKTFRKLHATARERWSERVLGEVAGLAGGAARTSHERYLALWRLLRERDKTMALAFDDPRRSDMFRQLVAIRELGLLEAGELALFSDDMRQRIGLLSDALGS